MSTPLKTVFNFLEQFNEHKSLFLSFFNMSFKQMIDPMLWYRDTEIQMDGIKFLMDSEFWDNVLGNSVNERVLLKAFYTHADENLLEDEKKAQYS